MAVDKVEEIRKLRRKTSKSGKKGKGNKGRGKGKNNQSASNGTENEKLPDVIPDVESQLIFAIRKLTCHPGLEHTLSDDIVGRPYADAMRTVYEKYPQDPEVAYCFAEALMVQSEALMVLNAWQLYEFPTGKAVSPDV
eukprot:CAMPEP_0117081340 /NCGR_PEP_ID=MMETSP0472-20121206/57337_1 /TAXON_ID=693140 ORGANISM="Tiarina fusus, Strain LIS" /NCGR_SAMPLE_ID=MMETSP0472 /ASSEMBLY_ACC=CAM_ASM_000603 /LENGTH=137 /DNA_ID=CAMNT_0004809245 /DNA_START=80 /DNA_END=490 /DNA_ORIENTATION=-